MVADPAQSIYAFAGASAKFIEAFERDFAAKRYVLGTTFRCGGEILQIAATLHSQDTKAQAGLRAQAASANGWVSFGAWDSERDEAVATIDWTEALVRDGLPASSVAPEEQRSVRAEELAIVARSRNHLRAILAELDSRQSPYHFSTGESGVFDPEEYSALLYGLKVLANERDVALARSLMRMSGARELERLPVTTTACSTTPRSCWGGSVVTWLERRWPFQSLPCQMPQPDETRSGWSFNAWRTGIRAKP